MNGGTVTLWTRYGRGGIFPRHYQLEPSVTREIKAPYSDYQSGPSLTPPIVTPNVNEEGGASPRTKRARMLKRKAKKR